MEIKNDEIIVFTSLIGENEGLNAQPFFKSSKLRRVCLTDDKNLISDEWEIILVNRLFPNDCYRSQRNFKIRPHLFFPNYKYSLYLDNTVVLKKKPEDFLKMIIYQQEIKKNEPFFYLPYHSQFTLIQEFNACANDNLDDQLRLYEQLNDYLKINLLALKRQAYWGGILFRNHNNQKVKNFSEIWFANICRYSRRDQLSIIHSSLQAKINVKGFILDNQSSEYHNWPIVRDKRKNRVYKKNYIENIPYNFVENLSSKIKENDISLLKIENERRKARDFNKFFKIKNFFNKFKNFIKDYFLKD